VTLLTQYLCVYRPTSVRKRQYAPEAFERLILSHNYRRRDVSIALVLNKDVKKAVLRAVLFLTHVLIKTVVQGLSEEHK
jgi:hypothetical protein